MDYGFEIRRDNQSVILNDESAGGVFIETLSISSSSGSGSKTYPEVSGGSLYFMTLKAGKHGLVTGTNGLGQATLTWDGPGSGSDTIVAVFGKRVTHSIDYGLQLLNASGEVVANEFNTRPQYLKTVQPSATPVETIALPDAKNLYRHTVASGVVGTASMLVFILCPVPDSSEDIWYSWTSWMYGTGQELELYVCANSGAAYNVPTLHLYSVNKPPTINEYWGLAIYNATGDATFMSSEANISVSNEFAFNFPERDLTSTYTVVMPTYAGIFLPKYELNGFSDPPYVQWYRGMVKRIGNQLVFKTVQTKEQTEIPGEPEPSYHFGTKNGNHGIVVDLALYGGGSVPNGVAPPPQTSPSFTQHPSPVTVQEGAVASFTVAATGNPAPSYQWYNGTTAIAGATSATYSKTTVLADNGSVFKCMATNSIGSLYSESATLTLQAVSSFVVVSISSHPAASSSAQIGSGQTITLYASASGTGPITYQWYDAGTSGTTYTAISGATSTSYSPAIVSGNNGRRYFCQARNSNGGTNYTADSNMATVTITSAPVSDTDATIAQHPSNVVKASGQTANFSVTAGGTGPFTYEWFFGTTALAKYNSSMSVTAGSSTVGNYRCKVTGATGVPVYSNYASLSLGVPPTISTQPQPKTVVRNGSAIFTVGSPNYDTIQWFRDDIEDSPGVYVGSGSSHAADTSTIGTWFYHCVLTNQYGSTESNDVMLQVTAPVVYPSITQHPPATKTTTVGAGVIISAQALNYNSAQWYRNGLTYGGNSNQCTPLVGSTGETGVEYFCRFFNDSSNIYTDTDVCVMIVNEPTSGKPIISTEPDGAYVAQFSSLTLSVTVSNVTADNGTNYQWFRDDVHVHSGRTHIVNTDQIGTFAYYCMVGNNYGITNSRTVYVEIY